MRSTPPSAASRAGASAACSPPRRAAAPAPSSRSRSRRRAPPGGPPPAPPACVACPPAVALSPGARPGLGRDERSLPEEAIRFVATQHPAGPVFNFLPFGGDLIDRLCPAVRVFIDGRTGWL